MEQFRADDTNFTGSIAGNPGTSVQVEVGIANIRAAAVATTSMARVNVKYWTMWYDRVVASQS